MSQAKPSVPIPMWHAAKDSIQRNSLFNSQTLLLWEQGRERERESTPNSVPTNSNDPIPIDHSSICFLVAMPCEYNIDTWYVCNHVHLETLVYTIHLSNSPSLSSKLRSYYLLSSRQSKYFLAFSSAPSHSFVGPIGTIWSKYLSACYQAKKDNVLDNKYRL